MKTFKELQKRLKELIDQGAALMAFTEGAEARALTEDEQRKSEEIKTDLRTVREQINTLKLRDAWQQEQDGAGLDAEWIPGARSLSDVENTENRTEYHGWPVDEAEQFFLAVRGIASGARSLP